MTQPHRPLLIPRIAAGLGVLGLVYFVAAERCSRQTPGSLPWETSEAQGHTSPPSCAQGETPVRIRNPRGEAPLYICVGGPQ